MGKSLQKQEEGEWPERSAAQGVVFPLCGPTLSFPRALHNCSMSVFRKRTTVKTSSLWQWLLIQKGARMVNVYVLF